MNAVLVILGSLTGAAGLAASLIAARTGRKVQKVSVQVDGRLSILLERQAQLLAAMHEAGTPIPDRPAEGKP